MSSKFYQIKTLALFKEFCKNFGQQGYHWASGHELTDSKIVDKFNDFPFPLIFDVDEDKKEIQYESNMKYAVYAEEYSPIKETKNEAGIYVKTPDGKEHFYDLDIFYKCPYDFNDFMRGLRNLQVGDVVKITDMGLIYRTYSDWFAENNVSVSIAARYAYKDSQEPEEGKYQVVAVGPHLERYEGLLCAIEKYTTTATRGLKKVYLIGQRGVERVSK